MIESLTHKGASVKIGHCATQITPDMSVIYSTDIKQDNPELQAAKKLNCHVLHRSELLQMLMQSKRALAVAGTHGKTTSSALLAWALHTAGVAPSFSIGGVMPQLPSHGMLGGGEHFVVEACESDGTFLNYSPYGALITNIDLDHLDFYGSDQALQDAFRRFMSSVASTEHLFWCGEDARLRQMQPKGIRYGFQPSDLLRASNVRQKAWSCFFDLHFRGKTYADIELALTGKHNVLNALAVFGLCLALGVDEAPLRAAFKSFKGVLRRCEKKGEAHGILVLDDYAHHPTELQATLNAIRTAVGERRIVAVYQPHRYSRTKACQGMYAGVFDAADELFVTEVYAAREQPLPGVSHLSILQEVGQKLGERCHFIERSKVTAELCAFLRPHDVLVTLGAGDLHKVGEEILSELSLKKASKYKVGVIFGGSSVEHDVSLMSAEFILGSICSDYYHVEQFGITRQGTWHAGPEAGSILKEGKGVPASGKLNAEVLDKLMQCDIIFPVLHGTYGEDGTLQGFFELLSKAYVGPDYRSAAITMDKALTKKLARDAGIPVVPFVTFDCYAWEEDRKSVLDKIKAELRYPLFVKPLHLGSTIGVFKVRNEEELLRGIFEAFEFDHALIVENGVTAREIEFAVLGNGDVTVYPPGEVFPDAELCTYAGKYASAGRDPEIIADLPPELVAKGIEMARRSYQAAGCSGMARVDTFLDSNGVFWLNEINPIPGCTKNSPFPKMVMAHGVTREGLIDRLIVLALERRRRLDRLQVDFVA